MTFHYYYNNEVLCSFQMAQYLTPQRKVVCSLSHKFNTLFDYQAVNLKGFHAYNPRFKMAFQSLWGGGVNFFLTSMEK